MSLLDLSGQSPRRCDPDRALPQCELRDRGVRDGREQLSIIPTTPLLMMMVHIMKVVFEEWI